MKVWDRAGIELMTSDLRGQIVLLDLPGIAVIHVSHTIYEDDETQYGRNH